MRKCVRLLVVSALAGALLVCCAWPAPHPRRPANDPPKTDVAKKQRWPMIVLEFVGEDIDKMCSQLAEQSLQLGWSKPDSVMDVHPGEFASIKAVIEKFGAPDRKTKVNKQEKEGQRAVPYDCYRFDENFFLYAKRGSDAVEWIGAPAGWLKAGIRKVAKQEADKAAEGDKDAVKPEVVGELPCALSVLGIKMQEDTALVTLEFAWAKEVPGLKQGDMTVVVLFQPKLIAPLKAELLAVQRNYSFNLPNKDLMKITSGLAIDDGKGKVYGGALILFCTVENSKVDFRTSAKQTIPIRMQREDRMLGFPAIEGKGVLCFALFKQDDPKVDQIKSTKYRLLSNVVSQEVELK